MTQRLYFADSYQRAFDAAVVAWEDDGRAVVLDRTALYPTSGGQPHDLGTLEGIPVVDVVDEEARIVHRLAAPLPHVARVHGTVDWARRWDHMQQHTGQHLLSGVFLERHGWDTVSVAFGSDACTIELDTAAVGESVLAAVESQANAVVWEARPVSITLEDAAEANRRLRKPTDRAGLVRIVTIADLDISACGGTHVRSTAEVGPVLLGRTERVRGRVRVEFRCGGRALAHVRRERDLLAGAAAALGGAPEEAAALATAQGERLRASEKSRTDLLAQLATLEARAAWEGTAPRADGVRVMVARRTPDEVEGMTAFARAAAQLPQTVVIGVAGTTVCLACAPDSGWQAGARLKPALAAVGGRGGGSPTIAQGTVPDAAVVEALVAELTR